MGRMHMMSCGAGHAPGRRQVVNCGAEVRGRALQLGGRLEHVFESSVNRPMGGGVSPEGADRRARIAGAFSSAHGWARPNCGGPSRGQGRCATSREAECLSLVVGEVGHFRPESATSYPSSMTASTVSVCWPVACLFCGHERLVGFSCKRRGFCPSCLGRRMTDTAIHLAENVFPPQMVRQWVCSLPWKLRSLLGYNKALCRQCSPPSRTKSSAT